MILAILLVLSIITALIVCRLMIVGGLSDIPIWRSNHQTITPTAGGVSVLAAIAVMSWGYAFLEGLDHTYPALLMVLACVGLTGLGDDIWNISTKIRFIMIAGASAIAVWIIGPVTYIPLISTTSIELPFWIAFFGSALWVFVVTLATNFFDGANGLMVLCFMIANLALAALAFPIGASGPAWLSLSLCAGLAGLFPFNARDKARIFSGDVGALSIGFGFAVSSLWLCQNIPDPNLVYIGPILVLPCLTDVLLTMLRRLRRKEDLLSAHKSHIYQRLIAKGVTHRQVRLLYGCLFLGSAIYGMAAIGIGLIDNIFILSGLVLISVLIYYRTSRRLKEPS